LGWATFDVVYDCSGGGSGYTISYKVKDVNDITAGCSCLSDIACGTLSTDAYCPGPCSIGPSTGLPVVRRADNSLGWTDYTMTTRQVASNISAYDLSKALYLDEIEIHGNAFQNVAANDLFVELSLGKATGGINKLTPLNVDIEIERGGLVISSSTLTTFDQSSSTVADQKVVWNLTSALPVGGLLAGDIIRTTSRYQVATNNLPQHDIQSGGSWYFFNTDGLGNRLGCTPLVPEMYLVGLSSVDGHNPASSTACDQTILGNFHHIALRFDAFGLNYFTEFRPGGYITKYELTVPPAFNLINCTYIPQTGGTNDVMTPDSVVGNTYTYNNPGTWEAYRTTVVNAYGAYIQPRFQPNCGAATNTEPVVGKVYVKEFYYHYADPTVTTYDKVFIHNPVPNYSNSPSATLSDQTGLVQASAPVESWRVRLNNPSLTTAPYTWIAVPNVPGVTIVQVIDEATMTAVPGLAYTGGMMYHLDAAGITSGQSKFYTIQFSYSTCNITDVDVLSGWNCGYFVNDPNDDTCGTMSSVTLSFQPQNAEVAVIPIVEPVGKVDLCVASPYEYRINSAQAGNLINNTFTIYSVYGLTPTAGSFQAEYPAGAGNWATVPVSISGNQYIYDLTAHPSYPANGIPGTNNDGGVALNRQMGVRFTVETDCNFVSGGNFEISTSADKSCGAPAIGDDSKVQAAPININGVDLTYLQANTLAISSGDFSTCGAPITLTASHTIVELLGGATTGSNGTIEVRLPLGFNYIAGSYTCTSAPNCATFDSTTTGPDGAQIIKLVVPAGLANTDVYSYTLQIEEDLTAPATCGDDNIELVALDKVTNVPCSTAPGGACSEIAYQTGKFTFDITLEKAILDVVVDASNAVISGSNENVTVDFTINNTATSSDAPAGILVEAYFDVNGNGIFDSLTDYLLDDHIVSAIIPANGSLAQTFTFTATPAQVCKLLLVVRNSENPCICSTAYTVIPAPTLVTNVAGVDHTICEIDTATLGIANNPAYTYSWVGSDAASLSTYLSSTTVAQPVFEYSGAALSAATNFTYEVTITRPGGCTSTDEVVITVNPTPVAPTATDQTFCGSATVSDLVATVGAGQTVKWYDTLAGTTALSPSTILANGYTYYAEAIGAAPGSCPSATRVPVTVTLTAAPSAGSLDGTQTICIGNTTTFIPSVAGGTWSSGTPAVASVDASGVVTGLSSGSSVITYTVTSGGCPPASVTRTVTVTAAPVAGTISGTSPLCAGSADVTFTSSGDAGGTWSSTNPFVASIDPATGVVTPNNNGTTTIKYTVSGTGGCADAVANFTLTIHAPAIAGTLSGTQDVCVASTTAFSVSGNSTAGAWSSSNTAIATVDASGVVTGVSAGSAVISYTVSGTAPCVDAVATRTVNVSTAPSAGVLSGTQTVCTGSTTTFSSTVSGGTWSSSNVVIASVDPSTGVITGNSAGTATITYTAAPAAGCPGASATRNVTVSLAPNAGANGTVTVTCSSVNLFASLNGSPNTGGTWSPALASGTDLFDPAVDAAGVYTYTVSGTAPCGNATATVTVTNNWGTSDCDNDCITNADEVTAGTDPYSFTFTEPADGMSTVNCPADVVAPTLPVITDACGNTYTLTAVGTVTAPTCEGTVTYTYEYTDASGVDHTWHYVYTVERNAFTLPSNGASTVSCLSAAVVPTLPTVTDDCGNTLTVDTQWISGSYDGCEGTRIYYYQYKDCEGNTLVWSYTYTIERNDFTMPANASSTVACAADMTTPIAPTVLDNCGNVIIPTGPVVSATPACEGTVTYTFTYTDCEGNTHDWVYTYTIESIDFVMPADAGSTVTCAAAIVAPTVPVVKDNCGNTLTPTGPVVTAVPSCEGTVTYTYTFTDCETNTHNWVYTYTLEREDFAMPANTTVTVACAAAIVAPTAPAVTDHCGNALTPTGPVVSATPACEGSKTYTYTYTDCENNTHDWVHTVIVDYANFTLPANGASTVACISAAVAPTLPTVVDACGSTLTEEAYWIGGTYNGCEGSRVYYYLYIDCAGHSRIWSYTYTIERNDFTVPANAGSTVACVSEVVAPTVPTVLDNCGNVLTPTGPVVTASPVCEGTITYTYTFTDCEGNAHPWVYTYTIEREDFTMPVNAGSTVACAADMVTPIAPTVTDDCGNVLTPTGPVVSAAPACEGTVTYTFTYTDCESNTHDWVYTYTIEREDFAMPANAGSTVACAADIVAPMVPVVTDHCGNALTASAPVITNAPACEGTVTYTYTFTDCEGNMHDWVYTYTIEREDFAMPAHAGSTIACASALVTPTPPAVTDHCGNALTPTGPVVSATPVCEGVVTYTWTYTDCEGNMHDWVYTYTIEYNDFTLPANEASTVSCIASAVAPTLPTVTDNCGSILAVDTQWIGGTFDGCEGTRIYYYQYMDCEGNAHTWNYTYTIERNDFTVPANAGSTVACVSEVVAPTVPTVLDNCGNVLTPTGPVVTASPVCEGTITYTYTFTDCEGNAHPWVYTYTIEREDFTMPVNAGSTVACAADMVTPIAPTVTDDCGNVLTPTGPVVSAAPACEGTVTYTFTYTDCESNTHDWVYTYTIEREDFDMPAHTGSTVACAADIVAPMVPVVTDHCGNALTASAPVITNAPACEGVVTYTYTFTDCEGNMHDWVYTYTIERDDFAYAG
jgi:uncharacterized protein YjdB/acyl-CoA hydrolase